VSETDRLRSALAVLEYQREAIGEVAYLAATSALREQLEGRDAGTAEGEWKQLTILFADISGFTGMGERSNAEELRNTVNACFERLGQVVSRYGGYIDKFIGDEMMVLFGAPLAMEDHASRALYASLAMRDALATFTRESPGLRESPLGLHFGINSGLVVAGQIGMKGRRDYTVMGDAVNVAARLVARAEQGEIFVGDATRRLGGHDFEFEDIGEIQVEGREQPVTASSLIRSRFSVPLRGGPHVLTPMFGRAAEMLMLQNSYQSVAQSGRPRAIVVVGPAGIGKSRLQREFAAWLNQEKVDLTLLFAAALPHMTSAPYHVVAELLRNWLGVSQVDSAAAVSERLAGALRRVGLADSESFEGLAAMLAVINEDSEFRRLLPEERMNRIFKAVQVLVEKLVSRGPVVLVVEDLHWADDPSVEIVQHLRGVEGQLLLLALTRPPLESEGQAGVQDPRFVVSDANLISLRELDDTASSDFVTSLLPAIKRFPELVGRVVEKGQGNPFFLEAIVAAMADRGIFTEDAQGLRPSSVQELVVPDDVWGVLAQRIDRLPSREKRVIQSASVVGRVFWEGLISSLAEVDAGPSLDMLSQRSLVDLDGPAPFANDWEWRFRHVLVQEVAYSSLLQENRKAAHGRTGQWLEARVGDRSGEYASVLTHHYLNAEDWAKTAEFAEVAGDRAAGLFAFDQARAFYLEMLAAMRLFPADTDTRRRRLDATLKLIPAAYYITTPQIHDAITEARGLAEELADSESEVRLLVAQANWQFMSGLGTEAVETARATIAQATARGLANLLSVPFSLLGRAIFILGDFQGCLEVLENSRVLAKAQEYDPLARYHLVITLGYLGMAQEQLGDIRAADEFQRQCLELAAQTRDLRQIGVARLFGGGSAATLGRLSIAREHLSLAVSMLEDRSEPVAFFVGLGFLGYCLVQNDELDEAAALLDRSLGLAAEIGSFIFVPYFHAYRAEVFLRQGDLKGAIERARAAILLAAETRQPYGEALAQRILAWSLHYARPEVRSEPEDAFRTALQIQRTTGARTYLCRLLFEFATFLGRVGDKGEASKAEAEARALRDELGLNWLPVAVPAPQAATQA